MIYPAPKPPKRKPKPRRPMKRTRMKACGARTKKSGGALFPNRKDPAFRRWLRTENDCLLSGRRLAKRLALFDIQRLGGTDNAIGFDHVCWGPIDPAHVGDKQSRGAPDLGHCVPLCRAAHDFYDQHRSAWKSVTGLSEKRMANEAGGFALKYVERGGKAA